MAFPQLSSFMNQNNNATNADANSTSNASSGSASAGAQGAGAGGSGAQNLDSLTLGQLKALVGGVPKPKQSWFDFKYDDEDTVVNEIDEFYSYIEMSQVGENLKAWEGSYTSEWTKSPLLQRRAYVELLLEGLEHRDAEIRFTNARRLFYILQGTFAETTSSEHQLHWIFENCKVVRAANGVSVITGAMKIASSKHDLLCSLTDQELNHFKITQSERSDFLEEVLTEISVYLGMLYHLIEVFKGYDDFADELISLDPPLPVYFINVLSGLRDKSAKGYPIKKLLLVTWKTLLACCGGILDYARVKKLARELAGLPPPADNATKMKSAPFDMEAFRQETTVKYPTYIAAPDPLPAAVISQSAKPPPLTHPLDLAQAYSPIPVRHHYHHEDLDMNPPGLQNQFGQSGFNSSTGAPFRPQPVTPAPSPPPPAPPVRPKKLQYQTDQTRPFLFPFSRSRFNRDARMVPFAIDEADRLYKRHMYVSLSLYQMWRTREDCINSESGFEYVANQQQEQGSQIGGKKGAGVGSTIGSSNLSDFKPSFLMESSTAKTVPRGQDPEAVEVLPDVALLNEKIEEAIRLMENAETSQEKRKAKQLKEDLTRLKRVEQIYSAILPAMSGWVLVLLKLLLATVSAATSAAGPIQPQTSTSSLFPTNLSSPAQDQPPLIQTLDDIDIVRHREITAKAVSAIILLTLKWFKVSHVMKFHHFGHQLLETNCLLLILKMFGLQEVTQTVVSKADSPDNNFFRYCLLNYSRNPQPMRPEENMPRPPRITQKRMITLPNGTKHEEEVEQVTDYSWRNFFATINFAKIMQKLSKGRSHRIWMLVQYKSSAVLKRVLRVMHPMLQLHILKLIKSQVPFCGRKWRQSNMKVITSIYLNCRPDLRDEWLTGTEPDDVSDAQAQEYALRHLVKFYNTKRYGSVVASGNQQHGGHHRRTGSMSQGSTDGLHPGPEISNVMRTGGNSSTETDVFPPLRSRAHDPHIFLPYITEDIAFEEEYEEYLKDIGWDDPSAGTSSDGSPFSDYNFGSSSQAKQPSPRTSPRVDPQQGTSAWSRLPEYANELADGISDNESIVSIGDLGDPGRLDSDRGEQDDVVDENLNNWEHMSPKTMAALPKSPGGRRLSAGSTLRPIIPLNLDDPSAVADEPELGPMPLGEPGPFLSGEGVDEVEYAYGV